MKEYSGYVSRGALKLNGVIKRIALEVRGKVILDAGSAHGGFVQTMLLNGAKKIYAVDVGKGLLDWKLRNVEQIVVMEGINVKELIREKFEELPDIGLIDVSFISLNALFRRLFSSSMNC